MAFKICVIGCGYMAMAGHGPAIKKYADTHPEVELTACCDVDVIAVESFRKQFGFTRYYTDSDRMLEVEKPDAVCLIVPTKLIAPMAIKILEHGYPVIMEKPPGLKKEDVLQILYAAQKSGTFNQVAFNRRYTPLLVNLKMWMNQLDMHGAASNIRYDIYRIGRKESDFFTTAIHGIDAARYIMNSDYRSIRFDYHDRSEIGENVSDIFMFCEFESGSTGQLSFCPMTGIVMEQALISATDHTIFMNLPVGGSGNSFGKLVHMQKGEKKKELLGQELSPSQEMFELNGFYHENESFFDAVMNGKKSLCSIETVIQSVEVMECIKNRSREFVKQSCK